MIKEKKYKILINEIESILSTEPKLSFNAKLILISAVLYNKNSEWLFCGFYLVKKIDLLEIGPYQSSIFPCTYIKFNRGVCGESASKKQPIIIDNVNEYPNYISCDDQTKSEIVIPLLKNDVLIGVLDIDSVKESNFDNTDLKYLTEIINLI
jgi:GAF domain-containing protein